MSLPGATIISFPPSTLPPLALGFFHLGVGGWLMYLTWAVTLNFTSGYHLPV